MIQKEGISPSVYLQPSTPSSKSQRAKKKAGWGTADPGSVMPSLTLKVPWGGLNYRGFDRKKLGPETLIHIFCTIV